LGGAAGGSLVNSQWVGTAGDMAGGSVELSVIVVVMLLASCLIYSHALKEYISSFGCWSNGYILLRDFTFREIRRRKGALFLYSPWKMQK